MLNNFDWLQRQLQFGHLLPVIKADAYGHNAEFVAQQLSSRAKLFAVAIFEEAEALRNQSISCPVVILEGVYSAEALVRCRELNFIPVLHCEEQLNLYNHIPDVERPPCWIKVDIGMHRLGFNTQELIRYWPTLVAKAPNKPVLVGHFSCADSGNTNPTQAQLEQFMVLKTQLQCDCSLTNSPAIINWPHSHMQWNRAGIALYGVSASDLPHRPHTIQPVMSLIAPILSIRRVHKGDCVGYGGSWQAPNHCTIATVAIGYADGYPRHASNGAPVWLNGQIVPVVGKVSMDMITIDISHCNDIQVGDEVELWGKHLPVEEVAAHCETIAYELVTRIGTRVPRQFSA